MTRKSFLASLFAPVIAALAPKAVAKMIILDTGGALYTCPITFHRDVFALVSPRVGAAFSSGTKDLFNPANPNFHQDYQRITARVLERIASGDSL